MINEYVNWTNVSNNGLVSISRETEDLEQLGTRVDDRVGLRSFARGGATGGSTIDHPRARFGPFARVVVVRPDADRSHPERASPRHIAPSQIADGHDLASANAAAFQ